MPFLSCPGCKGSVFGWHGVNTHRSRAKALRKRLVVGFVVSQSEADNFPAWRFAGVCADPRKSSGAQSSVIGVCFEGNGGFPRISKV